MAEEYGVTPSGINIKRLDTIEDQIHEYLSNGWGVNTKSNPKSLLAVLVRDYADKLAELWEFGAGIYWSMYPSTAEGRSLDNAAQFGGVLREGASRSRYPINCQGDDGTLVDTQTMIRSSTVPTKEFSPQNPASISLESCVAAYIKVSGTPTTGAHTITIGETLYTYNAQTADAAATLAGLASTISGDESRAANAEVDSESGLLKITAINTSNNLRILLSSNLTTATISSDGIGGVVSIITFASTIDGDVVQPNNTITEIVKQPTMAPIQRVWNELPYVKGRETETDVEFRKSYIDKIFGLSSRMTDSISSAILKLDGVESATTYENLTDYYDLSYTWTGNEGSAPYYFEIDGIYVVFTPSSPQVGDVITYYTGDRGKMKKNGTEFSVSSLSVNEPSGTELTFTAEVFPHSVESVVYGGSDTEIAQAIFDTKAAGINTYGNYPPVNAVDSFGNEVPVRFSRPANVYTYFFADVQWTSPLDFPQNGAQLIEDVIRAKLDAMMPGDYVRPQEWMTDIYDACSGIAYMSLKMYTSDTRETPSSTQSDYTLYAVDMSRRQIAAYGGLVVKTPT